MLNSDMDDVSILPLINRSIFSGSSVVDPTFVTVMVPFKASTELIVMLVACASSARE